MQKYEEYWKYTAALTNINEFDKPLKLILDAIDNKKSYSDAQKAVQNLKKINDVSARKCINQFVKIGLINNGAFDHSKEIPKLEKYHKHAKKFIQETGDIKETTLANIFLESNQLNASVTVPDNSKINRVMFLIKTLENKKSLNKDDLAAIMLTNVDEYKRGYITVKELEEVKSRPEFLEFKNQRKYNQIGHLKRILSILRNYIYENNGIFYVSEEISSEYKILHSKKKGQRSQIEQSVYRDQLLSESLEDNSISIKNWKGICMSSGLDISRSKLVASHIWAWSKCDKEFEFDPNNGLLLGENRDYFFDNGKISYDDNGNILIKSSEVSLKWKNYLKNDKISKRFMNNNRKKYLKIHRMLNNFDSFDIASYKHAIKELKVS